MYKNKYILFFLTFLLLCSLAPIKPDLAFAEGPTVEITTDTLNVREGPGLSYKILELVKRGDRFSVIEEKSDWIQVSLNSSGKKGWVAAWLVKKHSASEVSSSKSGIVTANQLRVRSGPSTSYKVVSTLSQGATVTIIKTESNWHQIKTSTVTGWVASEFIQDIKTDTGGSSSSQQTGKVTTNNLNVRSTSSTSGNILGKLQKGSTVSILSVESNWVKIQYNGQAAWISKEFVEISSNSSQPSVPNQPSTTSSSGVIGTITATSLNVRSTGSLSGKIVGTVSKGQAFEILAEENNWAKIKLTNDQLGWVASWYLSKEQSSTTTKVDVEENSTVTILYNGTNIRKSATTNSSVISRANAGETFTVLSVQKDWYEIQLKNGSKGFIAGWLVTVSGASQQIERPGAEQYLKNKVIVIDPGHGGRDTGATGIKGSYEKNLTLKTAQLLYDKLKTAGANVVMTRNTDSYLSLSSRVGMSHTHAADAFVSIHFDSILDSSVRGMTSYYYHNYQQNLATAVGKEVASFTKLKDRGVRYGDYHVLRENKRASVLLELGYLSNSAEETLVNSVSYQANAATGIYQGLAKYFK
ncbi:SH3 domain-containing protein [Robertmurraya korlensis]|uniref:SH3 domain-containing protein n=1 Tax=Robertmurraya korlensis TaxID=519977 RepID=UPI00203B599C|nr:SH3 domain-containing protein [Robertmurraya korlensis]MCM3599460.1 SH3 domain-containing protein [Robertmurraya korlensis]